MSKSAIITAFLFAPLTPAFTFASVLSAVWEVGFNQPPDIFGMIFVSFVLLMYVLPAAYIFTCTICVPVFLLYRTLELTGLKAYVISGCMLGIATFVVFLGNLTGPSWASTLTKLLVVFSGGFSGAIAGYAFWRIATGLP